MENPKSASKLTLNGPSDWKYWILRIETRARDAEHDVWDYLNPEVTNRPILTAPEKPTPASVVAAATSIAEFTAGQFSHYQCLKDDYQRDFKAYTKKRAIFSSIRQLVDSTVGNYYSVIARQPDLPQALKLLRDRVKPSSWAQQQDLRDHMRILLKGPGRIKLDTWISQWQTTVTEAIELDLPESKNLQPTTDFLKAVSAIDPTFAKMWSLRIEEASIEDLPGWQDRIPDGIKISNLFLRTRTTDQIQGKSGFAASFQGKDQNGQSMQPTAVLHEAKGNERPPMCLCGNRHLYQGCAYLNPDIQSSDWKPDEAIQSKVNKKLQNPRFRGQVDRAIKKWKGLQPTTEEHKSVQSDDQALGAAIAIEDALKPTAPYAHPLRDSFIVDSGANTHICNIRDRFVTFRPAQGVIYSGDSQLQIQGIGEVHVYVKNSKFILTEAIYLPGFMTNVISTERLVKAGYDWHAKASAVIGKNGKPLFHTKQCHGLPVAEYNELPAVFAANSHKQRPIQEADGDLWHRRLGHPNPDALDHIVKSTVGAKVKGPMTHECEACATSKGKRQPSRRQPLERAQRPFWRIYIDIFVFNVSYNSKSAALVVRDDFTKLVEVRLLNNASQDEVITHIKSLYRQYKNDYQTYLCRVHRDNDRAFSHEFTDWLLRKGITDEPTAPYTSAQNGPAERSGGVITTKARAMLIGANLPDEIWPEALETAAYLHNRSPQQGLNWQSPMQRLHQWLRENNRHTGFEDPRPNITHLKAYGCRAYPMTKEALENTQRRNLKTAAHAEIGYLVGYASTNIYKVWIPEKDEIRRVRDIQFDETKVYNPEDHKQQVDQATQEDWEEFPLHIETDSEDEEVRSTIFISPGESTTESSKRSISEASPEPTTGESCDDQPGLPTPESLPAPRASSEVSAPATTDNSRTTHTQRSQRTRKKSAKALETKDLEESGYKIANKSAFAVTDEANIPTEYLSAFIAGKEQPHRRNLPPEPTAWKDLDQHQFGDQFKAAATDEVSTHWKRGTFERIPKNQANSRPLPLTWVFKYKFNKHGFLIKCKARICVRGDLQPYTSDETYAATLAGKTFRVLMAITAKFDLEARHLDAINAFTNSDLDEEIYVFFPDGFKEYGWVIRLRKALYGLRRSPLLWQRDLTKTFTNLGFKACSEDPCVFMTDKFIIFVFVDDIVFLFRSQDQTPAEHAINEVTKTYEMKDLGDLQWFLGIRIIRDRSTRHLWLCQDAYIEKLASSFNRSRKESFRGSPLPHNKLQPNEGIASFNSAQFYQRKVGSINYAATQTRADVAKASSMLAEFLNNPSQYHHDIADRVLDYLYATRYLAIQYGDEPGQIKAYHQDVRIASDAAFADDNDTRKSSQGSVMTLFGGLINWKASKQATVTTSSTEAELLAFTHTAKEAMATYRLFNQLQLQLDDKPCIECDNNQTIRLITSELPRIQTALKHIDVYNSWARQEYQNNSFLVKYTPTTDIPADGLTKPLPNQKFANFVTQLGLIDIKHLIKDTLIKR